MHSESSPDSSSQLAADRFSFRRTAGFRGGVLACCSLLLLLACSDQSSAEPSQEPGPGQDEEAPAHSAANWKEIGIEAPFVAEPLPGVLTAGQLAEGDLGKLAEAGYKTIVNLRRDGENGNWEATQAAQDLGLDYVKLPIGGAETLTQENAQRLADLLNEPAKRPMVVHCGSSNRVGALFAVKAFVLDGASREEALDLGRSAGLTRMQPAVEEVLASFE